ncbi:64f02fde-2451-41fb-8628-8f67985035f8 [Sclerotinia trifoliorum]|uniref:64f02fde-2451-41fb-8628-8f67985035f8 n=1 Tax=Sclerotinia trifoliorum TaxID=28548 RepID=A0A8H2VR53_9HELO|nr:64f02fde-2451-41fb-8628-8f67985035f8 [Sclerotinia trifoliorum]
MDPDNTTGSEWMQSERFHHCDAHDEVRTLNQTVVEERDGLRDYVSVLEQQLLPRFEINGTNPAEIFVSQKNAYLQRVINLEKTIAETEMAQSFEAQKWKREKNELHQQIFGQNGYRDRLQSAHIALEIANNNLPSDTVRSARKLTEIAQVTREKDECNCKVDELQGRIKDLHSNWNAALREVDELREQKGEWTKVQDNSIALQEANREIERLRRANQREDSYHVQASHRQVLRLQQEKVVWEEEKMRLESHTVDLSLRLRTLEDLIAALEAQQSSPDVQMADIDDDCGTPSLQPKVLGDAVWKQWSDRICRHIQMQPQEVDDLYRLAAANLYRPSGALPDSDLRPESPRQQFPGVTWVKELVELACDRPVAPLVPETTWVIWADKLQDFVLTEPNELSTLYSLAEEGQRVAGAEWIRQLIAYAAKLPTSPEYPGTLKEYQLGVQINEAKAKIEELENFDIDREQIDEEMKISRISNQVLEQALETANGKIEELENEMETMLGPFEDEIEQLTRKLEESFQQRNLVKGLYESGSAHREALNEIEQLKKDVRTAGERGTRFAGLYEKEKLLSGEHEKVWQRKFDIEVAGADKHAAGLVEEAETLQGRLNGAHGVIADLEREIEKLKKQNVHSNTGDSGLGEIVDGTSREGSRQNTPDSHETGESEEEEEEEESAELKTAKTDLYNTLEEVEELKLKLGFADRAFDDMKDEFERKIATVEDNSKEYMTEKERMAEKLRLAEEKFKRGVAAEVRRLEREGLLKLAISGTQPEADIIGTEKIKGKGRKRAPAVPKPKKQASKTEEHESPSITPLENPLESPLESPDILMKDDEEYRGPKHGKNTKSRKVQVNDLSEVESDGGGARRSTRVTRNTKPVYTEMLKEGEGRKRWDGGREWKVVESGVEVGEGRWKYIL